MMVLNYLYSGDPVLFVPVGGRGGGCTEDVVLFLQTNRCRVQFGTILAIPTSF